MPLFTCGAIIDGRYALASSDLTVAGGLSIISGPLRLAAVTRGEVAQPVRAQHS